MASLLDRLLGRTETKAVTGRGAYAMTYYPSITGLTKQPNRLMAAAEALYLEPYVNVAERTVVSRTVRLPWHLEDGNGDTIDDTSPEPYREILALLERPNTLRQTKTRRQLWGLTYRHLGLAGNAFWYLDQTDESGTPLQILYINPARMTPALDSANNVMGWVLDARDNPVTGSPGNEGVPLSAAEVIHFTLDEPDWGVWGIGIAEAAQRKIALGEVTDRYITQTLGTGGRMTGILAPKDERTQYTDDEFKQLANDWRRIVDDPNAAKKLQILKKPVEHIQTSMSPRDLFFPDIQKQARDDILSLWGVPLSQAGIATPAGLNSGEKGKYDRQALYEGPVQDRGEALREKVQYELLDRFASVGLPCSLVLEYPNFDDNLDEAEVASKTLSVPLTVDERRQQLGLDPLDTETYGELGTQVYVAQTMKRITEEPEPAPVSPVPPPPPSSGLGATDEEEEVVEPMKAKLTMSGIREKATQAYEPRLKEAVRVALADQRSDISRAIRKSAEHLSKKASDSSVWWNEKRENDRLERAILPIVEDEARTVSSRVRSTLIVPAMKADSMAGIVEFVRQRAGERIKGINDTTREAIAKAVQTGVSEGLSAADLGNLIEDATSFNDARAEMIARTETMLAYNDSALRTFGQYDVAQVQAIDGDDDAECAARDGNTYALDDALSITDHPNGTLDWVPVV